MQLLYARAAKPVSSSKREQQQDQYLWQVYKQKIENPRADSMFLFDRYSVDSVTGDEQAWGADIFNIWQICVHSATAGEMTTFVNRYVRTVNVWGNALDGDFCHNYNLCASKNFLALIESAEMIGGTFLNHEWRGGGQEDGQEGR